MTDPAYVHRPVTVLAKRHVAAYPMHYGVLGLFLLAMFLVPTVGGPASPLAGPTPTADAVQTPVPTTALPTAPAESTTTAPTTSAPTTTAPTSPPPTFVAVTPAPSPAPPPASSPPPTTTPPPTTSPPTTQAPPPEPEPEPEPEEEEEPGLVPVLPVGGG